MRECAPEWRDRRRAAFFCARTRMPRSRPRAQTSNATRGGGEKSDGRDGLVLLQAGRHHWLVRVCVLSGWKNLAIRIENVSLLGSCATLAWSVDADAVLPGPFGICHEASVDDDNA